MPTLTIGTALVHMTAISRRESGDVEDDSPWSWPAWVDYTKAVRAPWREPPAGEAHAFGWTTKQITAVREYVKAYSENLGHNAEQEARVLGHKVARALLNDAVMKAWRGGWGVARLIRETLKEEGKDVYSVVISHGSRKVGMNIPSLVLSRSSYSLQWPAMSQENLFTAKELVGETLFGGDAYKPNSQGKLKAEVLSLLESWFVNIWAGMHKKFKRDVKMMTTLEVEVKTVRECEYLHV